MVEKQQKSLNAKRLGLGYTLVEIVVVIAIISIMASVGMSMFAHSTIHERRTAVGTMGAMVDLARNLAIARRREVILAFASPDEIAGHGQALRLGMFLCDERWSVEAAGEGVIRCRAVHRWRNLQTGVVLMPGSVGGAEMVNPLDAPVMRLSYGRGYMRSARVHGMVFGVDGGLLWPVGDVPAVLRLVAGSYERGVPVASRKHDMKRPPENVLQVGRGVARAVEVAR